MRRVRSLLRIQPGEGVRVALMLVYSAAAVGGVLTVGYGGVAEALFLSRLPASDVPFTLVLPSIALVLTLLFYNRVASWLWLPYLAVGSCVLLLAVGLAFRLLLNTGYAGSFPILAAIFLYTEVAASVMILQFWTFAGQIFDPRQARRLFGLIAAGGTLSTVLAGIFLATLVRIIGVDNLILVVAASLAVCGMCCAILARHLPRFRGRRTAWRQVVASSSRHSLRRDLANVWRVPLLRAMAGLTILVSLLINIAAYQFFLVLQSTYAGRAGTLAVFLGQFAIWTGIAALGLQLFVTSSVMTRFGIFAAQLFFPVAMGLTGGAILLMGGGLGPTALTRACDATFRRTTHEASFNALYLPVPAELRQKAKALLEALYAITFGLAGGVFLVMQPAAPGWTYQYWSVPVILLAMGWLVLLFWTRRQYMLAVEQSVNARRLDFESLSLDITDETTVNVLVHALHSADERQVVHVLHLSAEAPRSAWLPHVSILLTHPSPQVRVMALEYLRRAEAPMYSTEISALLQAPEDEVRAAAIDTLFAVAGPAASTQVAPCLNVSAPRTVGAAVTALLGDGNSQYAATAAERLAAMLRSDQPAMRREGTRVLGRLAGRQLHRAVQSILDDGEGTDGHALPARLVRLLRDKVTRSTAADSLVQYGYQAVPFLAASMCDSSSDRAVRVEIAKVLEHIGSATAAAVLLDRLADPDEVVRAAIYNALSHFRRTGADFLLYDAALKARISAELTDCYRLHVWRQDLREPDDDALLVDTLHDRIDRAVDRILSLVEIQYPGHHLIRARLALAEGNESVRGMAVELLDSLVDRGTAELLLPLLEAPIERILSIASRHFGIVNRSASDRLAELAQGSDPWLRSCAIARIGALGDSRLMASVTAALEADDPLVCETAITACRKLLDSVQLTAVLRQHVSVSGFATVRRYAQALLLDIEAS